MPMPQNRYIKDSKGKEEFLPDIDKIKNLGEKWLKFEGQYKEKYGVDFFDDLQEICQKLDNGETTSAIKGQEARYDEAISFILKVYPTIKDFDETNLLELSEALKLYEKNPLGFYAETVADNAA